MGQARAGAGGDEFVGDLILGLERVVGPLEPAATASAHEEDFVVMGDRLVLEFSHVGSP